MARAINSRRSIHLVFECRKCTIPDIVRNLSIAYHDYAGTQADFCRDLSSKGIGLFFKMSVEFRVARAEI